jgi:release factor glutamine methyltransferase
MPDVRACLAKASTRLKAAGCDTPDLDARLLLAHVLGQAPDSLRLSSIEIASEAVGQFEALVMRRLEGEPVSRIVGRRAFWTLDLALSPDTLDPRPDTETLVEVALKKVGSNQALVADLGTGTGAILLALLAERGELCGIGIDISPLACSTALANARAHGLERRALFVAANWADALSGSFDLVVSNPPYIATAEIGSLEREVRMFDPARALDGGQDGLGPYPLIAAEALRLLKPGGWLVLEIGETQAQAVSQILTRAGFATPELTKDLGGNDRVLAARQRAF